ncbi:hypothetical protein V0R55_26895, partial [Pseudomonas soli]|nr:hypothetical protein [Pseudomonas soli]
DQEQIKSRSRADQEQIKSRYVGFVSGFYVVLHYAIAGQARSHVESRSQTMLGAGLPRDVDLEFPRWQLATSCVSAGAARNFATSGGRTEVLRREVTGMDARQALRPMPKGTRRKGGKVIMRHHRK